MTTTPKTGSIEDARRHPQLIELWIAWCSAGDTEFTRGDEAGEAACICVRRLAEAVGFPAALLGTKELKDLMFTSGIYERWREGADLT